MNKAAIRMHLEEAAEQLAATLKDLDLVDFAEEELRVDISHVYHHVNSAWNGRDCTAIEYRECSAADFNRWRKFPTETELYLQPLAEE